MVRLMLSKDSGVAAAARCPENRDFKELHGMHHMQMNRTLFLAVMTDLKYCSWINFHFSQPHFKAKLKQLS